MQLKQHQGQSLKQHFRGQGVNFWMDLARQGHLQPILPFMNDANKANAISI